MSSNLDIFWAAMLKKAYFLRNSGTAHHDLACYLLEHRGEEIEEFVRSYLNDPSSPIMLPGRISNLSRFFKIMRNTVLLVMEEVGERELFGNDISGRLIGNTNDRAYSDGIKPLLKSATSEILARADERSIPVHSSYSLAVNTEKFYGLWISPNIFGSATTTHSSKAKEILRFCNCITEFYVGEPLFSDRSSTDCSTRQTFADILDELKEQPNPATTAETADPIFAAWQAGYLECKLLER